ncbi:pimeloyl-ACP methyl ester carboxylesterase [Nocardiopsis mwathae]|uniref:Pimeloyl-ACP methyl ester carboxylesterase n=1 Tax=Nocardiopsis mwathae TaxID=1472723 RepID=A0A7W9YH14_9ACTN|nr:alpha/beta hydrolase [Nocardiopsis mwathae]MBB6171998.1 pimeloyl-ACP methyl ester carboxylesterase [Nocardiopsis mwathae]
MTDGYRTFGHGDHRVMALNGWFGSAEAWRPLLPHLDPQAFSFVCMDYRGYGARKGVAGEYSLAEAARDALALADDLGWERFSVIGHSMGGSVMQRILAEAPERVCALVGVSPVPASGIPFDAQSWKLFTGAVDDPLDRRTIIDFTTGGRLTGVWLDAMVEHSVANSEKAAFAAYLEAWARTDFHASIAGSPVPIKAIVGEHDPAISAEVVRSTFEKWYPNLEVDVLANAGHYAVDETPIALATSIERFLAEVR